MLKTVNAMVNINKPLIFKWSIKYRSRVAFLKSGRASQGCVPIDSARAEKCEGLG